MASGAGDADDFQYGVLGRTFAAVAVFRLVTPALYLLAGIKSYIRYDAVATVLPEGALSKHRGSYILLAPLTALLFEYNLIRSALTRSITWRQIRYRLISPNRTEVLSWRRRKLNTLIFFVTSHCNATCDTCFYWDELNRPGDLDWKEIVKLSESTPQITDLWFSGGEPTLRRDLEDIIDLFVAKNGVRHINLPTNGLKPRRIYEIAERCLEANPNLELHINIALDGLRDSHDAMRGVPGNFDKAIESARMLRSLKPMFGHRLEVHINTVHHARQSG